jgi:hypothetical protein
MDGRNGQPPVVPVSGIVPALPVADAHRESGAVRVEATFPDGADLRAVQATAAAASFSGHCVFARCTHAHEYSLTMAFSNPRTLM